MNFSQRRRMAALVARQTQGGEILVLRAAPDVVGVEIVQPVATMKTRRLKPILKRSPREAALERARRVRWWQRLARIAGRPAAAIVRAIREGRAA